MPNLLLKGDGNIVQKTHIARTHDEDDRCELLALPETETKLSLLGNLFLSNGMYLCLFCTFFKYFSPLLICKRCHMIKNRKIMQK